GKGEKASRGDLRPVQGERGPVRVPPIPAQPPSAEPGHGPRRERVAEEIGGGLGNLACVGASGWGRRVGGGGRAWGGQGGRPRAGGGGARGEVSPEPPRGHLGGGGHPAKAAGAGGGRAPVSREGGGGGGGGRAPARRDGRCADERPGQRGGQRQPAPGQQPP